MDMRQKGKFRFMNMTIGIAAFWMVFFTLAATHGAPEKAALCGSWNVEGSDSLGGYRGEVSISSSGRHKVTLAATLRYADGRKRSWTAQGRYRSGRISFSYALGSVGIAGRITGTEIDEIRIRGTYVPAGNAKRMRGRYSGRDFSGRDVLRRSDGSDVSRDSGLKGTEEIPFDPFDHDGLWYSISSARFPLVVRFTRPGDLSEAKKVLAILERSWKVQVEELGFRPPFPHDPGGRGQLQVFLIRDQGTGVDGWDRADDPGVWWDAYRTYITIDAWGDYGGNILPVTTTHEFNHTLQAACDWYEATTFMEMTATYMQEKLFPGDDDYLTHLHDFQKHADWPIDYDDGYETWFQYGASMYLFFLEQRYFSNQPRFLARMWEGCRNRPRAFGDHGGPDPATNEPDWIDALNDLLPAGKRYEDTVVEFARWRYYVGENDDGRHFHDAHRLGREEEVPVAADLGAAESHSSKGPMLLGSEYIRLNRPAGRDRVKVTFQGDPAVRWKIQVVPGLTPESDGEMLSRDRTVRFGDLAGRTLIITAYPAQGTDYDPDTRTGDRYGYVLSVTGD
jgi:hypothetical protein